MNERGQRLTAYCATALFLLFTVPYFYLSGTSLSSHPTPISLSGNVSTASNRPHSSSQLILWLESRGLTSDRTLFISIADAKYLSSLHNFRQRLDQWGYGENLVVMCLDQDCRDYDAFHGYPGFVGQSVAYIKVRLGPQFLTMADFGSSL